MIIFYIYIYAGIGAIAAGWFASMGIGVLAALGAGVVWPIPLGGALLNWWRFRHLRRALGANRMLEV